MPKVLGTPAVRFELCVKQGHEARKCPIRAVMSSNRVPYRINIGDGCKPSEWGGNAANPKATKDPVRRSELEALNRTLLWWATTMQDIWESYHKKELGKPAPDQIAPGKFRELVFQKAGFVTGEATKVPTLLEFAEIYVSQRASEKGDNHPTVNTLRYGLKNLNAYCKRFGVVSYDQINFEWLEKFRAWLFKKADYKDFKRRALNQNSAGQVVLAIKQFVGEARKKEYTTNSIAKERGFSVKKSPTNKVSFHVADLEKLVKCDLSKHPQQREMERVRLLTVLACCTGLRQSDWVNVRRELVHEEDGELLLNVFAKKTKAKIGIPFVPLLRNLLEEHDWQIPKMTTQRYNEAVKVFCRYAGIDRQVLILKSVGGKPTSIQVPFYEVVSSHACRRTFISTMLLLGVPASQILPITGHSTEIQMRNYAQIEDRQNAVNISKQFKQGMMQFLGITNVAQSPDNA